MIGLPQEATAGVDDHPREELVRSAGFSVVAERQLEGFFSDESTSHWWSLPEVGGHL